MKLTLNTLCELFGNHYGSSFYLLGTQINDLTQVTNFIDEGLLSPQEIHNLLNN